MQLTDHSSNKNIIEKEQLLLYFHPAAGIKATGAVRHPVLRPYRLFHGELSHQYGNENFKFILFSHRGKGRLGGIEVLWSMQKFTSWKQNSSDIIYVPRRKHPLGNEQFSPWTIQARAGGRMRKASAGVRNEERTSAISWQPSGKAREELGSSACIPTRMEEAVCANHVELRYL